MVVVRYVFQAKWGKAGQTVAELKQNAETMKKVFGSDVRIRLLTDLSGPFDTLVQELEFDSLADWERVRAVMFNNPELEGAMAEVQENPFVSGRAEFYTLEAEL